MRRSFPSVWSALVLASVALLACGEDPGPVGPDPDPVEHIAPEITAWLDANGVPFEGTSLTLPHDDLQFLKQVVGDARVVALGENTHGTRDFFEMKARILRFLVEELGFDAFLIEATWPESNRMDRYVRTGQGDPTEYLTGLYFWTWRTESVLEMIQWMRSHNEAGGSVGFHGFDMQFPGMALDNVTRYVAASSEDDFTLALRSLRVAFQYHVMAAESYFRDEAMAENTLWWLDRLGPDSKVVLWAHNYHVSDRFGAQGSWLRDALGDQMVIMGFSHESGSFTAVTQSGSTFSGLGSHSLGPVLHGSYEDHLRTAEAPRFVLDLRNRDASSPATSWLGGPRRFRFIGCCYDDAKPHQYWIESALSSEFDVMIHVRETRPTTVLAARYPAGF
ncbi:MAG: erythromycin esterase family protein [Gemmatimonadota bacterium]|nr:erythromycin esterase family protein [Gemmatimonadota bacterium]